MMTCCPVQSCFLPCLLLLKNPSLPDHLPVRGSAGEIPAGVGQKCPMGILAGVSMGVAVVDVIKGSCRVGTYQNNSVVLRAPIVCWGFNDLGQPPCEHLHTCVEENKDHFKPRVYKNLMKKLCKEPCNEKTQAKP